MLTAIVHAISWRNQKILDNYIIHCINWSHASLNTFWIVRYQCSVLQSCLLLTIAQIAPLLHLRSIRLLPLGVSPWGFWSRRELVPSIPFQYHVGGKISQYRNFQSIRPRQRTQSEVRRLELRSGKHFVILSLHQHESQKMKACSYTCVAIHLMR